MLITIDLNQKSLCRKCPYLLRYFSDGKRFRQSKPEYPQKQPTQPSGQRGRPGILLQAATDWLYEYLKEGPKPSGNKNNPVRNTIFGDAEAHGLTCCTVWNAARRIGIRKEKIDRCWYWSLPTETSDASKTN